MITALLIEESRWERAVRVMARPVAWIVAASSSVLAGVCLVDVGNVVVYGLFSVVTCVMLQVAWRRESGRSLQRRV